MTPQPPEQPRLLTPVQEARFRVLERMRHLRWCEWPKHRDCNCKAGRLMLALIEAEAAAPDLVASPPEAVRLLRELVDRWFLYSDDLPKADVMDRLDRLDAFHASADEARRYLASATEGETAE